jgi:hypothetical protein
MYINIDIHKYIDMYLGIAPLGFVSFARSDKDRAKPFKVRKYRNNKLKTKSKTSTLCAPASFSAIGDAKKACRGIGERSMDMINECPEK